MCAAGAATWLLAGTAGGSVVAGLAVYVNKWSNRPSTNGERPPKDKPDSRKRQ